jgi:hypothetical protein
MSRILELALQPWGAAELLDDDGKTLWSSTDDDEFKEEFTEEFLTADDAQDILEYLEDHRIISQEEFEMFEDDEFDVIEVSQGPEDEEPDDDEEDDED